MAKKTRRGSAVKTHRPRSNGSIIEFPGDSGTVASQPALWADEDEPIDSAQQLLEQAFDASDEHEARELARAALRLDPDHPDTLTFLSDFEPNPAKRAELLERAVASARDRIGPERFEEWRGSFWLELDTRPYMRARYQLAMARIDQRRVIEGIRHFEALLELCPADNLGVRFRLLPLLLLADHVEAARDLAAAFGDDGSADMCWSRVLIFYILRDFERAETWLARARRSNRHVEAMILESQFPGEMNDLVEIGSVEEAQNCLAMFGPCWLAHPMALAWLRQGGRPGDPNYLGALPPPPRPAVKKKARPKTSKKRR